MLSEIVKPDSAKLKFAGMGPPMGIRTLFSKLVFSPLTVANSDKAFLIATKDNGVAIAHTVVSSAKASAQLVSRLDSCAKLRLLLAIKISFLGCKKWL